MDFVKDVKSEISKIDKMNINPHLKWEYVKITIKSVGMRYGRYLAASRVSNKKKLYMELDEVEKILLKSPDDVDALDRYSSIKQQLEIIIMAETEGARIRSGQKRKGNNARSTS